MFGTAAWTHPLDDRHGKADFSGMIEISDDGSQRSAWPSAARGWRLRCPACGEGAMFGRYLKVVESCDSCGTELHHHRADDAPPYFTMFITGHVIVSGVLMLEQSAAPPTWVHAAVWLPLLIVLSLWLLPRVKGALVGLQWALRMHGFGGEDERSAASPLDGSPANTTRT